METLSAIVVGALLFAAAGFTLAGLLMRPPKTPDPETQDDPFSAALARAVRRHKDRDQ